jgi:hypothetical protein
MPNEIAPAQMLRMKYPYPHFIGRKTPRLGQDLTWWMLGMARTTPGTEEVEQ